MPVHRPAGNRRRTARIALAGTAAGALALGGGVALLSSNAGAVDLTSNVVISEVYGGGGNSGGTFKNDFNELYKPTATAIPVAGLSRTD